MPLPDVSFAEERSDVIESNLIAEYEAATGKTLYPADPVRLFLATLAYRLAVQNAVINLAGRQGLLAYATGGHLDHLGALLGVERLAAKPARTMLRYSLQEALTFSVTVPSGSRVATRDGTAVFKTTSAAVIEPGETFVDVLAEAVEGGSKANGLVAGQLCEMVDIVAYVASASNVSASTDGDDEESDDRLRERIRLAPEAFSVAGPEGAYRALTLAASTEIAAVSVTTPTPGTVDIRLVMANGELPDPATIELVQKALSAEDVRPLTDNVQVAAPDTVSYDITGKWYATADDSTMLDTITEAVAAAVESYRLWQRSQPGRDINPSELIRRIMDAGAKRVELSSPVFQALTETQLAVEDAVSMIFGGIEDV
ncbi:baseplate J/gp47 family protein [Mailhella massiliensis]|uniref:Baseplate J/gp47 family protein n=1 Tax=Mailhella massiliensis TaxID=1903261 RepID=A0A921AXY3_9BACT|nr:baseplate J/gp47 family protein [Mailhella massiliensis]HJD97813.1 baseplate J/gp47 family protein [Mailhella massiliensis]